MLGIRGSGHSIRAIAWPSNLKSGAWFVELAAITLPPPRIPYSATTINEVFNRETNIIDSVTS